MEKLGNTSSAVMQQRHDPKSPKVLDDFPTPPWGSRLFLAEVLQPRVGNLSKLVALEPTCNRGYMARPMAEYFGRVIATDIADYGWAGQQARWDFLTGKKPAVVAEADIDWIMFNPPFARAEAFVKKALSMKPKGGVAMVARSAFLEGEERYLSLFKDNPPWLVAQSSQRLPMHKGRYNPDKGTATAYSWFVWKTGHTGDPVVTWTPEYRDRYKRRDDVTWEKREGEPADWIAEACTDTPLFSGEG